MLNPDILREKPQEVRLMLQKRGVEFDIDGLLAVNEARLKDMASCDAMRHERNKMGKMISEAKKTGKDPADLFKKMSQMSEQIAKAEETSAESEKKYRISSVYRCQTKMLDGLVRLNCSKRSSTSHVTLCGFWICRMI